MQVEKGNKITVHYTVKLEDGQVFETSEGREPITFEVGSNQVIPGVDEGVIGMKVGDKKSLNIPPDKGYGDILPDYIHEISINVFPEDEKVEVGMEVAFKNEEGKVFRGIIQEKKEETVIVDFNNLLAGKTITFDVELVKIA